MVSILQLFNEQWECAFVRFLGKLLSESELGGLLRLTCLPVGPDARPHLDAVDMGQSLCLFSRLLPRPLSRWHVRCLAHGGQRSSRGHFLASENRPQVPENEGHFPALEADFRVSRK